MLTRTENPLVIQNVRDSKGTFDIVYMPWGNYIDRMCRALGSKNDDNGEKIGIRDIKGCYDYNKNIMYLSDASESSVKHEYNHRLNPPRWDGSKWVYDK